MLVGVFGTIGSGKGIVCSYLKKRYGFGVVSMGNIIRVITKKKGLPLTRENLHKVQDEYHRKYGKDYVIKLVLQKIRNKKYRNAVVDGIRTPEQAAYAKKHGATLILIDAKPELRFERMKKRRRKHFSKTFEEFKKEEAREWKTFNFKKTFSYADYKIMNNGTTKELFDNVDKLIKRLG